MPKEFSQLLIHFVFYSISLDQNYRVEVASPVTIGKIDREKRVKQYVLWVATKSSCLCFAPGTTAGSSFDGKRCMQWTALIYSVRSHLVREPHSFLTLVLAGVQAGEVATTTDRDKIPHRNILPNEVPIAIAECR